MTHRLDDTVLVTGAAGFIGSHACDVLLHSGYRVAGLGDLSAGFRQNADPRTGFAEGSVTVLTTSMESVRIATVDLEEGVRRMVAWGTRRRRLEIERDLASSWEALD